MLLAGLTNCLCGSLVFALAKFRQNVDGLSALAQFQDFCTVTESVQAGIPVAVTVEDATGRLLRSSGGA